MIPLLVGIGLAIHLGPLAPGEPARQPQMAARGPKTVLAFGEGNAIYFSDSADGGKIFSPPSKLRKPESFRLAVTAGLESSFRKARLSSRLSHRQDRGCG